MRKMFLTTALLCSSSIAFCQLSPEQRIQDSVIGWWSDNHYDREWKSPADAIGKKKEIHINNMVEWMKKSYTPVGGLGTLTRYMGTNGFGVKFLVWNVSHDKRWTDPKGNFRPIPEENTKFYISANLIPGSYPFDFINRPDLFLFTWQMDGYDPAGGVPKPEKRPAGIHPNASKFITVRNEMQSVMLAPNNKLPFIPVTRGELLQLADDAISKQYATANDYDKKNIERVRTNIAKLKEKYKNSFDEPANIRDMQPTIHSFDFTDPFELSVNDKNWKHYYPVYKITGDVLQKMKAAEPQWVTVWLPYETKEDGNQLYEMYTAITQNLNYEYIYNYFFSPEIIKNIPYKPSNEEQLNARLAAYRSKGKADNNAVIKANLPAGVHFMEDFSSATVGQAAPDWFFRTFAQHCTVVNVNGESGKWLQLGYNTPISPTLLKKPLPENFMLEYDVVTDGGYSTRTGGAVRLTLNSRKAFVDGNESNKGDGSKVEINITPGNESDYNNNNYRGEIRVKINSYPKTNEENFSEGIYDNKPLKEFTDKKTRIHVAVKVKNSNLSIFVNNKEISNTASFKLLYGGACKTCGLPQGTLINNIFWTNTTDDSEHIKVYIGNIKISKL
ncbi:hypothetical protein [Ferruginibacter sp.]